MIISEKIRKALRHAVEISGSTYSLSKVLGIRHTTIRDWLSGKTKSISDGNWEKVRRVMENLPDEELGQFKRAAKRRGREQRYLINLLYCVCGGLRVAQTYGTFIGLNQKCIEAVRECAAQQFGVPIRDVVILSAMELED